MSTSSLPAKEPQQTWRPRFNDFVHLLRISHSSSRRFASFCSMRLVPEDVFEDATADSSPEDEPESDVEEDWGIDGDEYGHGSFLSLDGTSSANHAVNAKKARKDLLDLKAAGFKVGVIGRGDSRQNYSGAVYISAAIRISKLDLSDDTLVAWALKDKEHYLILMMYYPSGTAPQCSCWDKKTTSHHASRDIGRLHGTR
jgi:hypothetical protein